MDASNQQGERFNLRWTNFSNNLIEVFSEHRLSEKLVDVTIICEGQYLKAHKLVLSASSGFFQDMFRNNTVAGYSGICGSTIHPYIVLNGIKFNHFKHVIDFIYHGEVRILDSDLVDVLALGEQFQVKGLCSVKLKQKAQNEVKNSSSVTDAPLSVPTSVPAQAHSIHGVSTVKVEVKEESTNDNNESDESKTLKDPPKIKVKLGKSPLVVKDLLENNSIRTGGKFAVINEEIHNILNPSKPMNLSKDPEVEQNKVDIPESSVTPIISLASEPVSEGDSTNGKVQQNQDLQDKNGKVQQNQNLQVSNDHDSEPNRKKIKIVDLSQAKSEPFIVSMENRTIRRETASLKPVILKNLPKVILNVKQLEKVEESTAEDVPRAPHAFMMFTTEWRQKLRVEHPDETSKDISIRLGNLWRSLTTENRDKYYLAAAQAQKEHEKKYLGSTCSPQTASSKLVLARNKRSLSTHAQLPTEKNKEEEDDIQIIDF